MNIHNEDILDIDGVPSTPDLNASVNLKPCYLGNVEMAAIQITFTGSAPTGSFKLQASCDQGHPSASIESLQYADVSHWTDVANSSQAVTAAGSVLFNIVDPGYNWVRVAWTFTSGTGNVTIARINTKGE